MSPNNYLVDETEDSLRFSFSYGSEWFKVSMLILSFAFFLPIIVIYFLPPLIDLIKDKSAEDFRPYFYCFSIFFLLSTANSLVEVLWQFIGKEIVDVNKEYILIRHQIFGIETNLANAKCNKNQIIGMFLTRKENGALVNLFSRQISILSFERGQIEINYKTIYGRLRIYRFGSILADKDARLIFAKIQNKFPEYKYG